MSVYQRTDGRWVHKWKDTTRPKGKQWVQVTYKTEEEARASETEKKEEERDGSRLTVYEAVGLFLKDVPHEAELEAKYRWLVGGARPDQTRAKQKVGYAECIADRYVDTLDRRDLNMVRDCAREGGASPVTINLWTGRLEAAFRYCASEGLIPRNPWENFKPLRSEHGSRKGTLEQVLKVWSCSPPWLQWMIETAFFLFLRPGRSELYSLRWKAFRWEHGAVTIYMPKVHAPKTVYPAREYLERAWGKFVEAGQDKESLVCVNGQGRQIRQPCSSWRKACIASGTRIPMYAIRHAAASEALERGGDLAAVAANLGHKTPATTARFYLHAMPSSQKAASAQLGAAWCGFGNKKAITSGS